MEKFRKDWPNDVGLAEICTRLYEHLLDPANRLEHFSYYQLAKIAGSHEDVILSKALQYLSSPGCRILSQLFLYFDADEVWEFESADMAEFFTEGRFAHPRTGVEMDLDEIAVAFATGAYFLEAERN